MPSLGLRSGDPDGVSRPPRGDSGNHSGSRMGKETGRSDARVRGQTRGLFFQGLRAPTSGAGDSPSRVTFPAAHCCCSLKIGGTVIIDSHPYRGQAIRLFVLQDNDSLWGEQLFVPPRGFFSRDSSPQLPPFPGQTRPENPGADAEHRPALRRTRPRSPTAGIPGSLSPRPPPMHPVAPFIPPQSAVGRKRLELSGFGLFLLGCQSSSFRGAP